MDWTTMTLGPIFQSMAEVEENSADVEKANIINIAIILTFGCLRIPKSEKLHNSVTYGRPLINILKFANTL